MRISRAFFVSALATSVLCAILRAAAGAEPMHLDFEDGTLEGWTATGDAFARQPVRGDTVAKRRGDMKSGHAGNFWVGGYEFVGDDAKGTLTSSPFKVTHRWSSFLIAGGAWAETRVELVAAKDDKVVFKCSGYDHETLRPVVVDLEKHLGKEIFIRLVDERVGHWGHVNFDEFRFHAERPTFANE